MSPFTPPSVNKLWIPLLNQFFFVNSSTISLTASIYLFQASKYKFITHPLHIASSSTVTDDVKK